ncbi:hypothetical protein LINPERHAP1_LOCUS19290 [Linum perenne]
MGFFLLRQLTSFSRILTWMVGITIGVWLGGGKVLIVSSISSGLFSIIASLLTKNGIGVISQTRLFALDVQFIRNPFHM